jgi:hypothetical protein
MEATRCPECGETRWQLMGLAVSRDTHCCACGAELVPERRLPGRRHPPGAERRIAEPHDARPVTPA